MPRFLTLLVLTLALALSTEQATALGFGQASGGTMLGQPLGFTVGLRLDPGDTLESKCVRAEVSFGERTLPDALVRTRLERQAGTGVRRVQISTTIPVDEPVVALRVHLGCPAALSRDFMVLADPPGVGTLARVDPRDDNWLADSAETAVSPIVAAAAPSPASAPTPRSASRRERLGESTPTRGAARESARPKPRPRTATASPPSRGSVLRLDPVETEATSGPQDASSAATQADATPEMAAAEAAASAAETAASAAETAQAQQRAQEQERLKAMEATLLQLRRDSQATQKALAEMQLRLRAAEAGRYANPLVYGLGALCAVLALGLVAMTWLRRRDRAVAAWWAAQAEVRPATGAAEEAAALLAPATAPESLAPAPDFPITPLAPLPPPPSPPPAAPRSVPQAEAVVPEPRRPMSAEELIDLEQQAEFFVVLGQDDAAIDLLMGHVRSTGGVSPLPYLKLLEIYRRRGEREPYDRIRERFNRRFNAYAPEWDVDPEEGLSLEGYPEVMSRLQNAWDSPSRAMELLDGALFRRDAGPTFDVPAYRELLFLYSMARDLAERDVSPDGVDLLLPLGDEAPSTMTSVPASPAAPPPLSDIGRFSLDLDVSTDQPPRLSLDDTDFKRSGR
ncbi:MAG: hypothetical protein KF891_04275 [Rhizobacter sp.]|nr:hypothetical protein [Rhizobacter sp.]